MSNTKHPFSSYTVSNSKKRGLQEQADELRRELDVRRRIYDRWVADCKLSWSEAHDRMERMQSALKTVIEASEQNIPLTVVQSHTQTEGGMTEEEVAAAQAELEAMQARKNQLDSGYAAA